MSLVEFVIDKLDDLKGSEIVHFDVKAKSSITENMIICTGASSRQDVYKRQGKVRSKNQTN